MLLRRIICQSYSNFNVKFSNLSYDDYTSASLSKKKKKVGGTCQKRAVPYIFPSDRKRRTCSGKNKILYLKTNLKLQWEHLTQLSYNYCTFYQYLVFDALQHSCITQLGYLVDISYIYLYTHTERDTHLGG